MASMQLDAENQIDFNSFRYEMDLWIKDMNSRMTEFGEFPGMLQENIYNTEHNYELINEMKTEVEQMRNQLQTLKMTQLLIIKKVFREDFETAAQNKDFMANLELALSSEEMDVQSDNEDV